jgi:hypothetical protein
MVANSFWKQVLRLPVESGIYIVYIKERDFQKEREQIRMNKSYYANSRDTGKITPPPPHHTSSLVERLRQHISEPADAFHSP